MRAKIIILFLMAVILLSVPVLTQNLPMVYADQSQIPAVTQQQQQRHPHLIIR